MPPTRTSAPFSSPSTVRKSASSLYVFSNMNCLRPTRNTPIAKMRSVETMNSPNRNARHIYHHLFAAIHEFHNEFILAVLQLFISALEQNFSFMHQRDEV